MNSPSHKESNLACIPLGSCLLSHNKTSSPISKSHWQAFLSNIFFTCSWCWVIYSTTSTLSSSSFIKYKTLFSIGSLNSLSPPIHANYKVDNSNVMGSISFVPYMMKGEVLINLLGVILFSERTSYNFLFQAYWLESTNLHTIVTMFFFDDLTCPLP